MECVNCAGALQQIHLTQSVCVCVRLFSCVLLLDIPTGTNRNTRSVAASRCGSIARIGAAVEPFVVMMRCCRADCVPRSLLAIPNRFSELSASALVAHPEPRGQMPPVTAAAYMCDAIRTCCVCMSTMRWFLPPHIRAPAGWNASGGVRLTARRWHPNMCPKGVKGVLVL